MFYRRHGVDEQIAADMAEMFNRHNKTVRGTSYKVPDYAKWAEDGRDDLVFKHQRIMKSVGDEAMMDPGFGDRPLLRAHPVGRLIQQFTSFMHTASSAFVAPLMQNLRVHPTHMNSYGTILLGILMGNVVSASKAWVRGEDDFEQWQDNWGSSGGRRDNLYSSVLLSPLMPGLTANFAEVGMSQFGRPVNDRFEDVAGIRPFKQAPSKFMESQGLGALLGPGVGFATGTVPRMVQDFADGDMDKVTDTMARRAPIFNLLGIKIMSRLLED
jgi:hypothetical protein